MVALSSAANDAPAPKASNPFAKAKAKPEGEAAAAAPSKNNPFAAAKKPPQAAAGAGETEEARMAKV